MRFIMAAVTLVLAVALLPCQGFAGTIYVRLKAPQSSLQNPKKPVKK
jgi:hypothetical protein